MYTLSADNCASYFADITLQFGGNTVAIQGLCSSIRSFLTNQGINNDRYVLTYDGVNQARRRRETCGTNARNPCGGPNGENVRVKTTLGPPFNTPALASLSMVNCDEFPFASTEEGGWGYIASEASLFPTTATGVTRTCVPSYQNDLQGNCNGKSMSC